MSVSRARQMADADRLLWMASVEWSAAYNDVSFNLIHASFICIFTISFIIIIINY